jgi:hypothetical protein
MRQDGYVSCSSPTSSRANFAEWLSSQTSKMSPAEVIAIEVRHYAGEGLHTLVPRVIGQIEAAAATKRSRPEGLKWSEKSFFEALTARQGTAAADVARDLHAEAEVSPR